MNAQENRKVELRVAIQTLAEVKIQRGIFQVDVLPQLISVIAMIPHKCVLKKCAPG